jgi:lysophospholipase L1-like esterase
MTLRARRAGVLGPALLALTCGAVLTVPAATMADEPKPTSRREPASVAAPRTVEQPWMSLAEWKRLHQAQLQAPERKSAQVVFLGDSLTEGWTASEAFKSRLGSLSPLDLGIGGDQTQHLLWRIEDGALTGLSPKLFVVLIGVNNLGNGYSHEETASGVRAVVEAVKKRFPLTPVLLLGILPSGAAPTDEIRLKIIATNTLLRPLAAPGSVTVADVGPALLGPGAKLLPEISADALHFTPKGYDFLTGAVAPLIQQLLPR